MFQKLEMSARMMKVSKFGILSRVSGQDAHHWLMMQMHHLRPPFKSGIVLINKELVVVVKPVRG